MLLAVELAQGAGRLRAVRHRPAGGAGGVPPARRRAGVGGARVAAGQRPRAVLASTPGAARVRRGPWRPTGSAQAEPARQGAEGGSLGLLGGIVMGIASTAPAYSLAASLGYVVIARERRRHRRGEGAADHGGGVRPDVLHRGRLLRAQQGRARLRHDVHLGGAARSAPAPGGWAAGASSSPTSS